MRRLTLLLVSLAVVAAGCGGSYDRSTIYTDTYSGLSVLVTCEVASFDGATKYETCSVRVLEEGNR